ncbi:rod shape-determining protein [Heliobacterium chlorum]|uniref:Rod shape-determining protein n=1 Tax=Heliobacterium chlorum TaxID=2698 RepID=A0ABR7T4Y6_HELCL|nr:cell division FtsA domain-containing protein [Heliobacterium chlorum]MBC9785063.1 rod shape-determining protein [Heliobacterium chlorum]
MSTNDFIFALDIGTRSVVGIIAREKEEGLEILHTAMEEHRHRAMLDGQIHDVVQVSNVVRRIKQRLESQFNQPLKEVAVAAAGRALKIARGRVGRQSPSLQEYTSEDVFALELTAVQNAQKALKIDGGDSVKDYHCVGYSVVNYYLEGQTIGNLVGQRGLNAEIEVIGTFLPRVVVDSLFSVLQRVDLEMKSLTLEPIAAISVVIPPNMRQLNLALVDVGAGTSDIAITSGGTVTAYAMVPIAGDEMTEQICQKYLLEFGEGERAKRALQAVLLGYDKSVNITMIKDTIQICDVLGFEQELDVQEMITSLGPAVEHLACQIADKIIDLNGKTPQAVILVGGGSLTPLLPAKLAEALGLPRERVGVRGRESLRDLSGNLEDMKGPEFVTPVGIAFTSVKHQTLGFYEVTVNDEPVRLFNMQLGSVGDALVAAGVSLRQIHGLPGLAMTVEVNGQVKILRGTLGEPAKITVNGNEGRLDSPVNPGDKIQFEGSKRGADGSGCIGDVVPNLTALDVEINGQPVHMEPQLSMNGKAASLDTPLLDGARIRFQPLETIAHLLDAVGNLEALNEEHSVRYVLNGIEKTVPVSTPEVLLNDSPVKLTEPVKSGDRISVRSSRISGLVLKDIVDLPKWEGKPLRVFVNDKTWTFPGQPAAIYLNGQPATGDEMLNDGDNIIVKAGRSADLILSELLLHIGFDPAPPAGKTKLDIYVNGFLSDFATPITDNARVELKWR